MAEKNELIVHESFVRVNPITHDEKYFDETLEGLESYLLRLQSPLNVVEVALNVGIDDEPFEYNDLSRILNGEQWIGAVVVFLNIRAQQAAG